METEAAGGSVAPPELLGVPAVGVGVPAAPPCGEGVTEVEKLAPLIETVALGVGTFGVALGDPEAVGEVVPPPKRCVGLAPTL